MAKQDPQKNNPSSSDSDSDVPEEINFNAGFDKEKQLRKTQPIKPKKIAKKKPKIDLTEFLDDAEDKAVLNQPKRIVINKQAKAFDVTGRKRVKLNRGFNKSSLTRIKQFQQRSKETYNRLRRRIN